MEPVEPIQDVSVVLHTFEAIKGVSQNGRICFANRKVPELFPLLSEEEHWTASMAFKEDLEQMIIRVVPRCDFALVRASANNQALELISPLVGSTIEL